MGIFDTVRELVIAVAGLVVGAAAVLLVTGVYWFGLPILNGYPLLLRIPLIGDIAVGHLERVKSDVAKETRAGYVKETQLVAAQARLDEVTRQMNAGKIVIDAYQVQLQNARAQDAIDDEAANAQEITYQTNLSAARRECRKLDASDIGVLR